MKEKSIYYVMYENLSENRQLHTYAVWILRLRSGCDCM